ncbi:MAG: DUF4091 domain-containing protein [Ruminococcaceae bacterium]|nr:DUF4091 domain-containing protein [Oscillospiraceae bacterium]
MRKQIFRLFLAVLMAFSLAAAVGANGGESSAIRSEAETDRILGDMNADGTVNIDDALLLFQHSILPEQYPIDYPGMLDIYTDGNLDISDALLLFQHSMLPDQYPIEWGDTIEGGPQIRCSCGNIRRDKSLGKIGVPRLDGVRHQDSKMIYRASAKDWTITVDERRGTFEIRGWVGVNISDFELALRVGTYNPVKYRTWNATVVNCTPSEYETARAEGFANPVGFSCYFDMDDFRSGDVVHLLLKDKATGEVCCFLPLKINIASPAYPELYEKYAPGQSSTMDMSAYDPVEYHEPVVAPDDDADFKLWFDHITEKVARYDVSGKYNGSTSYTIQMGKNETEGCQFFLYSPTPRKVQIEVSDFENDKGETLPTELGVEYYIEDQYLALQGYSAELVYPDAIIPYDSYVAYSTSSEHGVYGNGTDLYLKYGPYVCLGPFSGSATDHETYPFRESVRGFVLQAETAKDTTPGTYRATVEIFDADTGRCIKTANVYTYVYDVTLSDETALDTAFNLWDINSIYQHHYNNNPQMTRHSEAEIVRAAADFFLEHRITLTGGISFFNTMGTDWFENPRVTSLRVLTRKQFDSVKNNPLLADKLFYYGQDEPCVPRGWRPITWPDGTTETVYDNTGLLSVLATRREADMLKILWGWKDYRLLVPFERIMDFTTFDFSLVDKTTKFPAWYNRYAVRGERDSIEYMANYVNIWTPNYTGDTPKDLAPAVYGEQYMQSTSQDSIHGEFGERMEEYRSNGDELWHYVSCNPPYTSPYQNILLFNDGTEGRTMFWTTYMLGGTGFLYWHVSYYDATGNNTLTMRCPFSKTGPGDGILVYPGSAYGQLDPIPSIRLLNMRDGIEEYQMLTMLEEAYGKEYTDELVSHIVTSTVTFTRDDDRVYNVHSYLLRALEEAEK